MQSLKGRAHSILDSLDPETVLTAMQVETVASEIIFRIACESSWASENQRQKNQEASIS